MKSPSVYLLANKKNGTLYIGVTSNLIQRVWQHKESKVPGFSSKYNLHLLVWYEVHDSMYSAITREKTLKKWNRSWKIKLIEEKNLQWNDLYWRILK